MTLLRCFPPLGVWVGRPWCARRHRHGTSIRKPSQTQTSKPKMLETFSVRLSGRLRESPVRIDDEFACDAGVEGFVAIRRLLKTDHLDVDDLGDGQSVPKYRLHKLPVVLQHRRLAGVEGVGLCPAETEAKAEVTVFGCLLLRARIVGHI